MKKWKESNSKIGNLFGKELRGFWLIWGGKWRKWFIQRKLISLCGLAQMICYCFLFAMAKCLFVHFTSTSKVDQADNRRWKMGNKLNKNFWGQKGFGISSIVDWWIGSFLCTQTKYLHLPNFNYKSIWEMKNIRMIGLS